MTRGKIQTNVNMDMYLDDVYIILYKPLTHKQVQLYANVSRSY